MNDKKDWPYTSIEPDDYVKSYVEKAKEEFAKRVFIYEDDKLICWIGLYFT